MIARTAKNGHWLATVYWLGTAVNVIAAAGMLAWAAIRLASSVHLGM